MHALRAPQIEASAKELDDLIALFVRSPEDQARLVLEHLQSARVYLLGSMPWEYEASLAAAKDSVVGLNDQTLRGRAAKDIEDLLEHLSAVREDIPPIPPRRHDDYDPSEAAGKSKLYRYFHGFPTTLGVFYPTHFIFASFPSLGKAQQAAERLRSAGYTDLAVASAVETARFISEMEEDKGLWGAMMGSISRFFGTEKVFADIDVAKAEQGAGFLAVYCPLEQHAERIRIIVAPCEPSVMQLYLTDGIQSLVAGPSPGPQGNHPEKI